MPRPFPNPRSSRILHIQQTTAPPPGSSMGGAPPNAGGIGGAYGAPPPAGPPGMQVSRLFRWGFPTLFWFEGCFRSR